MSCYHFCMVMMIYEPDIAILHYLIHCFEPSFRNQWFCFAIPSVLFCAQTVTFCCWYGVTSKDALSWESHDSVMGLWGYQCRRRAIRYCCQQYIYLIQGRGVPLPNGPPLLLIGCGTFSKHEKWPIIFFPRNSSFSHWSKCILDVVLLMMYRVLNCLSIMHVIHVAQCKS